MTFELGGLGTNMGVLSPPPLLVLTHTRHFNNIVVTLHT